MIRIPRPIALLALLAALGSGGCGAEETEGFVSFCTEVAMTDCTRGATPTSLCRADLIQQDCLSLERDGAWDAVDCMPPTPVEADNCLNRLSQFGGETPFEAVAPCSLLCPQGFF